MYFLQSLAPHRGQKQEISTVKILKNPQLRCYSVMVNVRLSVCFISRASLLYTMLSFLQNLYYISYFHPPPIKNTYTPLNNLMMVVVVNSNKILLCTSYIILKPFAPLSVMTIFRVEFILELLFYTRVLRGCPIEQRVGH